MEHNISYDENWQSVSEREYPEITTSDYSEPGEHEPPAAAQAVKSVAAASSKQLLITLQLILCVLLALAAFVLKSMGGDVYQTVREWYYRELNSSAVFDGESSIDLERLLHPSTADEAAH